MSGCFQTSDAKSQGAARTTAGHHARRQKALDSIHGVTTALALACIRRCINGSNA
ncbi:MAG: hypothetical protein UHZ01_05895 [Prevotella sp.]|nr:hypothetical protein [Prevotella sp.]